MTATQLDLGRLSAAQPAPQGAVPVPPRRWKSRVLLPALIGGAIIVLLLISAARALLPATPVRVVPVIVKTVEGTAGTVTVQAPGWLEPDPHPQFVAALADGIVEDVLVLEGDRVERDQVVVRLIDDDARLALARAEAELQRHRAALDAANAEHNAAELQLQHLVERSRQLAVSQAMVAEAEAELQRAAADVGVEQARLLELDDELQRKTPLLDSQAVSTASVARLRLRHDAQAAAVTAARARESVLEARLQQARADLAAARQDRDLLIEEHRAVATAQAAMRAAEAAVTLAEVARDEAALRLERMSVRTPMAGVVMQRIVSPGSNVRHGVDRHSTHVMHVYDPHHMQVRVDVPLADAANISVGQTAEITVDVLPDRSFGGRVTRVVHSADVQKNTIEVKVAIDDPTSELKPEMLARVRFIGREEPTGDVTRHGVFAPAELVRGSGNEATVLIVTNQVDERGRAELRSIHVGNRRRNGWIEIQSGLQQGDRLIVDAPESLEDGDRVHVTGEVNRGMGG